MPQSISKGVRGGDFHKAVPSEKAVLAEEQGERAARPEDSAANNGSCL